MKVLFSSFPKNVHTAWLDPQTKMLQPLFITKQTARHVKALFTSFLHDGQPDREDMNHNYPTKETSPLLLVITAYNLMIHISSLYIHLLRHQRLPRCLQITQPRPTKNTSGVFTNRHLLCILWCYYVQQSSESTVKRGLRFFAVDIRDD